MTYISLEAQLKDIALRNQRATAELDAMLEQSQAKHQAIHNAPPKSPRTFPSWISITVIAAVAAGFGLFAGVTLSGSLF